MDSLINLTGMSHKLLCKLTAKKDPTKIKKQIKNMLTFQIYFLYYKKNKTLRL